MKTAVLIFSIALAAVAQTNFAGGNAGSNTPESYQAAALRAEKIRADCIANRRIICGKILKVLPGGLVVDSGYTDLLRPALSSSWLVSGSVVANRPADLIESALPGSPCVGRVFITDLPRLRGAKPKPYDYVVLLGYPAGQATYTSVGTVQKTVRRFSANLAKAVGLNFASAEKTDSPPK
jgi:hypothetical protein